MNSEDPQEHVSYYIHFVENVLKPRLEKAQAAANTVQAEITAFEELMTRIKGIEMDSHYNDDGGRDKEAIIETMVDLGKQVFCNAVPREPKKIFVSVGMGFHVELSITEASNFAKKRISFLRANKLSEREREIKEIKDHIQSATIILTQLQMEMNR